jgi:hypothetical protein
MAVAMVLVCLTGCVQGEDSIVFGEDGTVQVSTKVVIEKAACDEMLIEKGMTLDDLGLDTAKVETVDGVESYVIENSSTFSRLEDVKKGLEKSGYENVYVSKTGLRYVLRTGMEQTQAAELESLGLTAADLKSSFRAKVIITMPEKILATTGTLSEDKKTAEFVIEGDDLYSLHDIMVSTQKETKKPTISGVTAGKTYNSKRTISVKDASGIKSAQYKKGTNGKKYSFSLSKSFEKSFDKNGTYTIYATDYYGNKTTRTFTIKDTKKPVISGATDGKTYKTERNLTFSDNCGVKSVKVYRNGKKVSVSSDAVSTGVNIKKSGTYKVVVADVNGLSKTISFQIKSA